MSGTDEDAATNRSANTESIVINTDGFRFVAYGDQPESPYLPAIRQLISKDLSEPYSIYVYRYFLYQWADLCFLCLDESETLVGVIICKLEPHRGGPMRGYIAMLATREEYRGRGIASRLVRMAVQKMVEKDADEVLSTSLTLQTTNRSQPRNRSLWKQRSTISRHYAFTRNWAFYERNDCIDTTSMATRLSDLSCTSSPAFRSNQHIRQNTCHHRQMTKDLSLELA